MTTEVESMFTKFLEGLKLSTAPLKVGDPTNKVMDANSNKGEANSEKGPSTSGRNGTGIFAHVEPPTYGGPIPSTQPYRSFQLVSKPRLFIKDFTVQRVWVTT